MARDDVESLEEEENFLRLDSMSVFVSSSPGDSVPMEKKLRKLKSNQQRAEWGEKE